jgi:hypothetical protein
MRFFIVLKRNKAKQSKQKSQSNRNKTKRKKSLSTKNSVPSKEILQIERTDNDIPKIRLREFITTRLDLQEMQKSSTNWKRDTVKKKTELKVQNSIERATMKTNSECSNTKNVVCRPFISVVWRLRTKSSKTDSNYISILRRMQNGHQNYIMYKEWSTSIIFSSTFSSVLYFSSYF